MKKGRSTPDLAEIAEFYGLSPAELTELSPAELAELDPAKLAEFSPAERVELTPAEIKAVKRFDKLEKFIALTFGPSKKLSKYAKHITPKDLTYFEKEKNKQLSAALSPTTRWRQMPSRVDDLAEIIVLLAPTVHHSDPPTKSQIYFWAMLEAYRDYMKTGRQESDREVSRQLTMDMAFAFCRLLVEEMNIASEDKAYLLKKIDALSFISRDQQEQLKKYSTERQQMKITQKEAAESINRIFGDRGLLKINSRTKKPMPFNVRTIRRWEKLGNPHPSWYIPGLRDLGKDEFDDAVRMAAADKANKRGIRQPSQLSDNCAAVDRDPSAIMDNAEREALIQKIVVLPTEDIAKMYELFEAAVQK